MMPSPRDEVATFAVEMERRLRDNDHKPGWQDLTPRWLLNRVRQELVELEHALTRRHPHADEIVAEAADVANFVMMIADNARRRA